MEGEKRRGRRTVEQRSESGDYNLERGSAYYLNGERYSLEVVESGDDSFLHFENVNGTAFDALPRQGRTVARGDLVGKTAMSRCRLLYSWPNFSLSSMLYYACSSHPLFF